LAAQAEKLEPKQEQLHQRFSAELAQPIQANRPSERQQQAVPADTPAVPRLLSFAERLSTD